MGKRFFLVFLIGLGIISSAGAIYVVRSGLIDLLSEFKGLYLIGGLLLIYTCLLFGIKAYRDKNIPSKGRLLLLFGPVISGGFAGLAGIANGLYPAVITENFWWVPLLFGLLSFISFQVAVIFAVLLARAYWKTSEEANRSK